MNFGAHICVADRYVTSCYVTNHQTPGSSAPGTWVPGSSAPGTSVPGSSVAAYDRSLIGLGSALPDLAAMGRFRLRRPCEVAPIAAGVAIHYLTDDLFHSHTLFTGWQRQVGEALDQTSLSRGARRAVAHVGPELMIDGVLLGRATNRSTIRTALDSISSVTNALGPMVNEPDSGAWADHLSDVVGWPTPDTLGDTSVIAQRLQRILSSRPRLAFEPSEQPMVAAALDTVADQIIAEADELTSELAHCLPARLGSDTSRADRAFGV